MNVPAWIIIILYVSLIMLFAILVALVGHAISEARIESEEKENESTCSKFGKDKQF